MDLYVPNSGDPSFEDRLQALEKNQVLMLREMERNTNLTLAGNADVRLIVDIVRSARGLASFIQWAGLMGAGFSAIWFFFSSFVSWKGVK